MPFITPFTGVWTASHVGGGAERRQGGGGRRTEHKAHGLDVEVSLTRRTSFAVLIVRTSVFWGLYSGPLIEEDGSLYCTA